MTLTTHLEASVPTFGDQREICLAAGRLDCQCQVQPQCRTTLGDSRSPIYQRRWSSLCPPTSRTSSPSLFSRFVSPRRVSSCPDSSITTLHRSNSINPSCRNKYKTVRFTYSLDCGRHNARVKDKGIRNEGSENAKFQEI